MPSMLYPPSMIVVLNHIFALEFWRYFGIETSTYFAGRVAVPCNLTSLDRAAWRVRDITSSPSLEKLVRTMPIHVLVKGTAPTHACPRLVSHRFTGRLPDGAVRSLGDGIYVSSPEFCIVQLARDLDSIALVRLMHELCGTYARQRGAKRGFIPRPKLATVEGIREFAESCPRGTARRKVLMCLKWVVEDSASPLETAVGMLLSFPMHVGGFGLPRHRFNHEVKLSSPAAGIARRGLCRLDISWSDVLLDVEVHGSDHESEGAVDRDALRSEGLAYDGYSQLVITKSIATDPFAIQQIARECARRIGVKRHWERLGRYSAKQANLFNSLFPWNAPYDALFESTLGQYGRDAG